MTTKQIAFIIYTLLSLGFFGYTCYRLWQLFKLTKLDTNRFDQVGKRINHTLKIAIGQFKILRKPVAGTLHALVFWGFIVITIGTAEMIVDGIFGTERVLAFLGIGYDIITASGEIFAAIILVAGSIFLIRRYITKPKRFEAPEMKPKSRMDATVIIFLIFLLMFSLIGMNMAWYRLGEMFSVDVPGAFPVSAMLTGLISGMDLGTLHTFHEVNWWIHIALVLAFLNILPYSKHFHVLLSVPNVYFKNFSPAGRLSNMEAVMNEVKSFMDPSAAAAPEADMGEPERFGIKDIEDISWKTLFDSYTCTECGRCTDVCPANITGKKLSPRKLFIDVRARMTKKGPEKVKNPEFDDGKSLLDYITPEELWGCTTCGACMQECPVEIEHVPLIVDMRRYLVLEESSAPMELMSMFQNIENNGAPWAMAASARFDWANELEMVEA